MSDISVNNQTNNNYKTAAIAGGVSAAAGVAIKGGSCYLSQKAALANPDEFIKSAEKTINDFKNQGCSQKVIKSAEELLENSKQLIAKGKVDFGAVGKNALIGAAIFGAIGTVIGLVVSNKKQANAQEAQNKSLDSMA